MPNEPIQTPIETDPRPRELTTPKSLLLVHTGHGKGKSSSAFGVMMRGIARGWNVCVVQFIKSGDWNVGEEKIGRQMGVEWHSFGSGFTWDSANLELDKQLARDSWYRAKNFLDSGRFDLLILDELTYLLTWAWVDEEEVVNSLTRRPPHVNVVVTGRDAPHRLIDVADTVTEMRNVKHAYQAGFKALRGIDY